jgi:hypothetical protein
MKLGGERLGAQDSISKVFARCNEWPARLERHGGAFYSPQGNLAIQVSKIRTFHGWGPDMSGQPLWKPAWGPYMFDLGT